MTTKTTTHSVLVLKDFSVTLEILHKKNPTLTYILRNSRGDCLAFSNTVVEMVRMANAKQTIDDLRAAIDEAAGNCEDIDLLTTVLKVLTQK